MYETLAGIAHSWGLYYAFALFVIALGYALWPGNKADFDRAAHAPLEDEDIHGE